ncbi:MAG: hypothetical protein MUP70_01130 [Candidatus Aminicenantes bacterium]|nr:hypothetical protein [Candidatus Aminicenantes bacterium]
MPVTGRSWVIAVMTVLFLSISLPAQEQSKLFSFSIRSGSLMSIFQSTEERIKSFDLISWDHNRRLLQGGLRLFTESAIYHPNLLTIQADLNLVGLRTKKRFFSDATDSNDLNNSYNIILSFLKKKSLIFSSTHSALIRRRTGPFWNGISQPMNAQVFEFHHARKYCLFT